MIVFFRIFYNINPYETQSMVSLIQQLYEFNKAHVSSPRGFITVTSDLGGSVTERVVSKKRTKDDDDDLGVSDYGRNLN